MRVNPLRVLYRVVRANTISCISAAQSLVVLVERIYCRLERITALIVMALQQKHLFLQINTHVLSTVSFWPGDITSRRETHNAFKFSFWSTSQHDSIDFAGISFGSASYIFWKNTEEAYSSSLTMLPRYFQYVGKTEEGWRRNPRQ